jgi:pimeloyl-ACP methyl ester carboxylesterase
MMHGYGGSMDPDVQYVPALHAAGFNVLMFDFRAHGRSDGEVCTVGYLERQDALAAVDFVRGKGVVRIGFLGFSMGGIVAILTAAICPHVAAVIADGCPARFRTALSVHGVELRQPAWLSAPLAWLALAVTSLRVGANQFAYEPVRWVGQIAPRPLLFIHGDHDQYVPPPDFDALVAAAGPTAEVWRVAEAGHRTVDQVYPEEYRRRVVGFFDRYL